MLGLKPSFELFAVECVLHENTPCSYALKDACHGVIQDLQRERESSGEEYKESCDLDAVRKDIYE